MTYRDRSFECPRCRVELARRDDTDLWACRRCSGALVGETELAQQLVAIAPELAQPHDGVAMVARKATETLGCPVCAGELEPVFLGGVEVERCVVDRLVWFDRDEQDLVLDTARHQHAQRTAGWLRRLTQSLFGTGWLGQ